MSELTTEKTPSRLLKAVEVAHILNVSRAFAYRLMQQGKIPTIAIGGARRVRVEDLNLYIENNLTKHNADAYKEI